MLLQSNLDRLHLFEKLTLANASKILKEVSFSHLNYDQLIQILKDITGLAKFFLSLRGTAGC